MHLLRPTLVLLLVGAALGAQVPTRPDSTRPDTTRTLPVVPVTAERQSVELARVGFYDRMKSGWGDYLSPDQVERLRGVRQTTSMLQGLSGIRLDCRTQILNALAPCVVSGTAGVCMSMMVDGVLLRSTYLDERVSPNMVHAVEVYSSPTRVPVDLNRPADQLKCGAVLVWTSTSLGDPTRSAFKRRLLQTAITSGVLFGVMLLVF